MPVKPGRAVGRAQGGRRDNVLRIKLNCATPLQLAGQRLAPGQDLVWHPVAGQDGWVTCQLQSEPKLSSRSSTAERHQLAPSPADDSPVCEAGHASQLKPERQAPQGPSGMPNPTPTAQAPQRADSSSGGVGPDQSIPLCGAARRPLQPLQPAQHSARQAALPPAAGPAATLGPAGIKRTPRQEPAGPPPLPAAPPATLPVDIAQTKPARGACSAESAPAAAPPPPPDSARQQLAPGSPLVPAFVRQMWRSRALQSSARQDAGRLLQEPTAGQGAAAASQSTPQNPDRGPPSTRRADEPSCCSTSSANRQESSASFDVDRRRQAGPSARRPPGAAADVPGGSSRGRSGSGGGDSCSEHGSRVSVRRERSFSCSTGDDGSGSDSDECSSGRRGGRSNRRRGGRHAKERRRRSRSPLRGANRQHAVAKRRAPPSGAQGTQLSLASLVDSMTEEAASLHRRLGQLSLAGGGADSGGAACESTSTSAAAATADVQGQLAALTSKLDQLALCLGGLQLQQQAQQGVHQLPAGSQAEAACEAGVTYVCWDTNVWMDQLKLIRECWKRLAGSGATGLRFLLPLAVVRELDGLKRCLFRGLWARRAVRKLGEMQGHHALRGQREDELYRGQMRRNDDGILDALLLFRARGAQVELCTRDANLALRAGIEGIPCRGPEDMRRRFMHVLDQLTAGRGL